MNAKVVPGVELSHLALGLRRNDHRALHHALLCADANLARIHQRIFLERESDGFGDLVVAVVLGRGDAELVDHVLVSGRPLREHTHEPL